MDLRHRRADDEPRETRRPLKIGAGPGFSEFPIAVDGGVRVSAQLELPAGALACVVLAHGAGAGMRHPFMAAVAVGLAERGVGTLRYQFPYMEKGSKRPDPPALCHATVRAAVVEAGRRAAGLPLFAGGKSFGGRMTSQAQALAPLAGVHGLVFLGFPLHPPGKPSVARGEHLCDVRIPMLFLQGTRDEFAERRLLGSVVEQLGDRATVAWLDDADHSFHAPARTGKTDAGIGIELTGAVTTWIAAVVGPPK